MRFRTFVTVIIVLTILVWAGYTVVYASSNYLEVSGLIERAVTDALQRRKAATAVGMPDAHREYYGNILAGIDAGAKRTGIEVARDDVAIAESVGGTSVTVKWSFPALTYGGTTYLTIPMSVTRIIGSGP